MTDYYDPYDELWDEWADMEAQTDQILEHWGTDPRFENDYNINGTEEAMR